MKNCKVLIIMGSDSDLDIVSESIKVLKDFSVNHSVRVASAHRTPGLVTRIVKEAESSGVQVIISAAGAAAHLGGAIAAHTTLPVIGIPIDSTSLSGMDALLATVQMPGGVPVATMAVGKAGAKNAALFAIEILALSDEKMKKKLVTYKKDMEKAVIAKDKKVQKLI